MSDFLKMKKNRSAAKEALLQKLNNNDKSRYQDERLYYPTRDKAGNGSAVIRFLPPTGGSEVKLPFVEVFNHGFKEGSRWFIENCPTTIGEPCPVCESNNVHWNSGTEEGKQTARDRKRKKSYYANILVVKDPANPENEGKVFLFKFGVKILEMIQSAAAPEFEEDEPIDVFDPWEGANFRLRIRKVNGMTNYDSSGFETPSAISEDDSVIEEIWKKQYDLYEFVDPKQFKAYNDLKKQFVSVTGDRSVSSSAVDEEPEMQEQSMEERLRSRKQKEVEKEENPLPSSDAREADSDDDDDFFAKLAAEIDD